MEMDRRRLLDLLGSGLLLSAAPSAFSQTTRANARSLLAALLLPVSGPSAAIGLSMQRATGLAQSGGDEKARIALFDTDATAEGAAKAAASAAAQAPAVVLGPLFARQLPSVAGAIGATVPIIAFSNNIGARDARTFEFGITPSQSVSAVLQYARASGVRRVALVGAANDWSRQAERAAQRLASEIGLQLVTTAAADAVLLTGGGAEFAAEAAPFQKAGTQVLGTLQALDGAPGAALEGAWISAPDPTAFAKFADAYRAAAGSEPGVIAALAYDAATLVRSLAEAGRLNRDGLLAAAGFPGVAGAVRFRPDGRCVRELAIVTSASGTLKVLGRKAGL